MSQVDRNCAFARAVSGTISSEAPTLALFAFCNEWAPQNHPTPNVVYAATCLLRLKNPSSSELTWSLSVEHMPCGAPR
jgi:hypothetical protein